jgi:spermidine synthase
LSSNCTIRAVFVLYSRAEPGDLGSISDAVERVLASGQTPYQSYQVVDIPRFGRTLLIENRIQSAAVDEHIYHECLVHPAMLLHPEPARVAVLGGGEGATLREVLRHPSVQVAAMVDIDQELVRAAQQHLPEWHQGAFDDPRTDLRFGDARDWLEAQAPASWDVIISDISEPVEAGPAARLFTRECFAAARRALGERGVFVAQIGSAGITHPECFAACVHTLSEVFPEVRPYHVTVPSFLGPWGFAIGSAGAHFAPGIDAALAARGASLRYYREAVHAAMFTLPPYLRRAMPRHERLLTDAAPVVWTA